MFLKYLLVCLSALSLTGCNFNPLATTSSSSSDFQCMQDGKPCEESQTGNSSVVDSSEPILSETSQVGSVDSMSTSVILSTKTNIQSSCRYDFSDKDFSQLSYSFLSDLAGKAHSSLMSIEKDKDYKLYVRCRSFSGVASSISKMIEFSTRAAVSQAEPVLSQFAPNGILPYTGPTAQLRLMTNKLSQCRYDQSDKDYDLMSASFDRDGTGLLHTKTIPVLASTAYQYYVRCIDSKGIKNKQSGLIRFAINQDNTDKVAPVISNVNPLNITYPGETASVTLSLSTNEKSICRFANIDSAYNAMSGMMIANAAGNSHTQQVAVMPAKDYRYYFRCSDQYGNQNTISSMASFKVDIKQAKDTTAPVISGLLPMGELSGETKQVELVVFTNEDAICRYGAVDAAYSSLNMMFGAAAREHKSIVNVAEEMDYRFYIRCVDTSGNQNLSSSLIGNTHGRSGVPTFMAGTAGGRIPKHNGHRFDNGELRGTPQGDIWLSVMQTMGINVSQWGGGPNTLGGSKGTLKDFNKPHSS